MQTHYVPITKSGWFYLWLCLVVLAIFANSSELFKKIELTNLNLWNTFISKTTIRADLVRVVDIDFDLAGYKKIQKLAQQHPDATFGFVGNYSKEFMHQFLNQKSDKPSIKAVFYSQYSSSASKVENPDNQFGYFIPQVEKINWLTSANYQFSIQPKILNNEFYFLWRDGDQLYPTFISELIIQRFNKQSRSEERRVGKEC